MAIPRSSTAEQLVRHARATGWSVPADLLAWSQRHGFQHPDALLIEIERSRQARSQGVATFPQAPGGGDGSAG